MVRAPGTKWVELNIVHINQLFKSESAIAGPWAALLLSRFAVMLHCSKTYPTGVPDGSSAQSGRERARWRPLVRLGYFRLGIGSGRLAEILLKKLTTGPNDRELPEPLRARLDKLIIAAGNFGRLARVRLAAKHSRSPEAQ